MSMIQNQQYRPPFPGPGGYGQQNIESFQQQNPFQQQTPWIGPIETSLDVTEYLVVAFAAPNVEPLFHRAKDAADMQRAVEKFRQDQGYTQIAVFKRMLRMKSTSSWETVDADV